MKVGVGTNAIVTGGARGLGCAIATALVARGASVTVVDIIPEGEGEANVHGSLVQSVHGDVADINDVRRTVHLSEQYGGPVDLLINNAATTPWTSLEDSMEKAVADLDGAWRAGVLGAVLFAKSVLPSMIRRRQGHIINVSTEHVHNCGWPEPLAHGPDLESCPWKRIRRPPRSEVPEMAIYDAVKWALNGLTFNWASALQPHGVQINNICPGAFDDDANRGYTAAFQESLPSWSRVLLPREAVAQVVLDLIEEDPPRSGDNVGIWCGHGLEQLPAPGPNAIVAGRPGRE
jgi:NAD(P)-dependent dehydrogenase (short-subunit alcohol dehydrogenase family)